MKPTIRDVARMAEVSISTVSRVMNAPNTVVESKRNRVMEAVERLQYQPNAFARGLIYKKSFTLGLLIPDIENLYFAGVIRGMQDACIKLGYSLMICNTDRDKERMLSYIDNFHEKQVDGIVFASDVLYPETHDKLVGCRIPFVLVSSHSDEYDIPSVEVDDEQAAYDAVKFLIDLGHKDIGMIGFNHDNSVSGPPRYEGFVRALTEFGLQQNIVKSKYANHRFEHAYQAAHELFTDYPELTAVFCVADEFAMGTISYLKDRNILVPGQVSVIGFDNLRMSSMFIPKLTTIAQPIYELGYRAAEMLHELLTTGGVQVLNEKMEHKLIVRESTREK
ncbi:MULTISPECIES: LacI family DNA-binding transcriptional regulator [Paenibacillus]|jgi:LacI family transcriptional regulator|uniref:LacI family transcriptional regulator n=1 Tax=Paenibacillus odorifer TaxID=189426 RepID=A0A1R0Z3Y8_9BACL|nr:MULTISPECIES: LacI family DNA-binding transcriptional regulator [Paenibacillus]AIQ77003.1 catabolite control protein A [Paenibacillus odorifer]AWV36283.1 LacI family transcriptional regulator [Paenibacillus odorifer]ETT59511.1 catabolite control protein A [Paenibacillus sp. FSL H8-237]MDH6428864.1 LacI family transcriptional regulator [Paenibacillus sp. PastH-4]MDH6445066.1 LacI family transcriptional regulator [Paenibacillus sp. PastF-4]